MMSLRKSFSGRRRVVRLIAAIAFVFCVGASIGRSAGSPCDSVESCGFSQEQVDNTNLFLSAFIDNAILPLDTWDVSTFFCTWDYITCTTEGANIVTGTDAALMVNLPALADDVVGSLVMITTFDVSGNLFINGDIQESWSGITALQSLSFANTAIGGEFPPSWSSLVNMVSLDFTGTTIGSPIPADWSSMTKLQSFKASSGGVTGSLPASWSAMTQLTTFSVSGSSLTGTLPASWSAMTQLTTFSVSGSSLTGTLPASWSALQQLQVFQVDNNALTGSIPASYGSLGSLTTVALQGNTFCGCLPAEWKASSTINVSAAAELSDADCATANSCFPLSSSSSSLPTPAAPSSSSSSSSSSDLCNADISLFTEEQVTETRTVLNALRDAFPKLTTLWQCSNFCGWYGVTCTSTGVAVALSNENLQGTMPDVPENEDTTYVMLTSLDLSNNRQLMGSLPLNWLFLPLLDYISLANCGLSGELPK